MPGPPFRAEDGVELRPIEPDDHAFLVEHWNRPDVRLATDREEPLTVGDVADIVDDEGSVNFLVCADGERVGTIWLFGIDPVNGRGEVGYWIAAGSRDEGYATDAVELLMEYAVDEQRIRRLVARVFEGNGASMRVLEKAGFEPEGVLRSHYYVDGEYLDATLFGWVAE